MKGRGHGLRSRALLLALAAAGCELTSSLGSRAAPETTAAVENHAPPGAAGAPTTGTPRTSAAQPAQTAARDAPPLASAPLRFLALGGGPTPESNEVSLEQDIELVQRALPGPGLVLFAGGSRSASVRELADVGGDALRLALGDLFAPRIGRQSRYRYPRFSAERATLANVEARLGDALARGDTELLVYVASHGERGDSPSQNAVALWGGHTLDVTRLAALHERHTRPLRLIATSCFSGGFAELVFAGADAAAGKPSRVPRCGLFAGTADRETSGCDANPDRRAQESYGLHLAHALAGRRRDGAPLPLEAADFDRDGRIGLLDAHTWARIAAVSVDVPTTTSERWLRHATAQGAPIDRRLLPEEAAVVERLGAALGLRGEAQVQARWAALDRALAELDVAIAAAEDALAERAAELGTELLESWPLLDDPFHPGFDAMLAQNREAIAAVLDGAEAARARREAEARARQLYTRLDALAVEEARVLRVLRAYETQHAAAALMARGGPDARHYQQLLACERGAP